MNRACAVIVGLAATGWVAVPEAQAAENAAGFYLLGSKGAMAGYVPPPGTYVSDINYGYAGEASGNAAVGIVLRRIGDLTLDVDIKVDGDAYINAPIATWIAPEKVLGGNIGFGIMVPWGYKKVDAQIDVLAELILPDGTVLQAGDRFNFKDSTTNLGDPVLNALIGWHEGNWHWNFSALLNVPIGPWDRDSVTNISFHHWGLDTSGAFTYLDAAKGHEVSMNVGFTFNWENPNTDYKTGTEFHVEWALIQHLSKTFSIGLQGYHYQQLTGDSGSGAVLGGFEGRATALGPVMTYSFQLGKIPVSSELKYLHEFDVKNRLEGDVGLLTLTMPLSLSGH